MPLEEGEGLRFLFRCRVVDATEDARAQLTPHAYGAFVPRLRDTMAPAAAQGDRLGHDMVGGEDEIGEVPVTVLLENGVDPCMIRVVLAHEGEKELPPLREADQKLRESQVLTDPKDHEHDGRKDVGLPVGHVRNDRPSL